MSKRDDTVTGWIRGAVDQGATSVEEIHKAIADLPLDVLERNGLFEEAAAQVRKIQDRTIGAVYDVIREVNNRVNDLASDLLTLKRDDEV
jgi:uncharacterized membrane protein